MQIAIGSDHRGVDVKTQLTQWLQEQGHHVVDAGAHDQQLVDYPDVASVVASHVARQESDRGILLCGTGIGMSIAANKVAGIRAATAHSESDAEMSRRHNDLNVLCLSGESDVAELKTLIAMFLATEFEGGRHARRVSKISQLEKRSAESSDTDS